MNIPDGDACKECGTSGYTYEHKVFMGDTVRTLDNKSWKECAEECDKYSTCFAFSYNTVTKKCFMKRTSMGNPIYKENFVHSRACGTSESNCPSRECSTCSDWGSKIKISHEKFFEIQWLID